MRRSMKHFSVTGASILTVAILAGGSAAACGTGSVTQRHHMEYETDNQTHTMDYEADSQNYHIDHEVDSQNHSMNDETDRSDVSTSSRTSVRVSEDSSSELIYKGATMTKDSENDAEANGVDSETDTRADISAQRYELDMDLREHSVLAVSLLRAQHLDQPDVDALEAAIETNNQAIASSIGQLYPDDEDDFLRLWRNHIEYYQQYLTAAEQGDNAGRHQAMRNLDNFAAEVAALLGNSDSQVRNTDVERQLTTHTRQTTDTIDALVEGDYTAVYELAHEGYEHMGDVAASIAAEGNGTHSRHRVNGQH